MSTEETKVEEPKANSEEKKVKTKRRHKMKTATRTRNHKVHSKLQGALELLNEAAQEKRGELYDLIGDKYSYFKDILADTAESGKEAVSHTKKEVIKAIRDGEDQIVAKAKKIDKQLRANPWTFVGVVAVSSLLLGYIMHHKK